MASVAVNVDQKTLVFTGLVIDALYLILDIL